MNNQKNTEAIKTVLSKMTEEEKEAHIGAIEIVVDYGTGNVLSDEEIALYNAIIEERSKKEETANSKNMLDSVIADAEQRCGEQNEIDTNHIDREAR